MSRTQSKWSWLALCLCVGAYIPFGIGGWNNPHEVNVASFSIWLMLAVMFTYSSWEQGFAGWRFPLGFLIGNASMLVFAFTCLNGRYTFDLGTTEIVGLYGVIGTICAWVIYGTWTGTWSARILFYGSVLGDVISFYPQAKQWWGPNEPLSIWGISGWSMWFIASGITAFGTDELLKKLRMCPKRYVAAYKKPKNAWLILESSLFSLEQLAFIGAILPIMMW